MLLISIVLFILNVILIVFSYFGIKNKFSNKNYIKGIKQELQNLISKIAFETDMSVSVLENKINEANAAIAKLEKIILLAESENQKREKANQLVSNLQTVNIEHVKNVENNTKVKKSGDETKISEIKEKKINSSSVNIDNNPVKIYTLNSLTNDGNIPIKIPVEEQVIELAKKGFSIDVIAEKTQLPSGEIELLLSMNNI